MRKNSFGTGCRWNRRWRSQLHDTRLEATVRYAAELGYEVTVVKDASASYSDDHMRAALDVNIPNYASAVLSADEIVGSLSSLMDTTVSVHR